ncbi:hypothetical protein BWQ96_00666 [Gracilariopsis chorda]|uniref:Uncharacterized protein n=1 Tax=Gracilariopsis chorda TaxID=448386 RepID=A0A2V3J583_9FLOR|nr:hypothetical protein BWQ96_00666 [Gracilariopsis chorda]|eukprot:PXF49596.1 hypothetical protein BWQ96_00666 [Gracilariopsis chorda]
MALRLATGPLRRSISGTAVRTEASKLPFEKPIFESELLNKAVAERESCRRLEFYGNVAVVIVGISALARFGYYVIYGKEGGAKALPPRRGD